MEKVDFSSSEWFSIVEKAVIEQYTKAKIKGEVDNSVLAAFLLYDENSNFLQVISLATGTKLMSGDQRESSKDNGPAFIHDCHAEILAHRCFQLWCWDQIEKKDGVLKDGVLAKNYSLHFYTSTPPCGDCCVHVDKEGNVHVDTGAKPFGCDQNDLASTPPNIVRGKPGRGSRSQVVSCSDKIAMWLKVGVEGSYLSNYIHLELSSLVIGGGKLESCKRSLFERMKNEHVIPITCLESNWKSDITCPSSSSFTWFLNGNAELIAPKFGRRVGVIPKNQLNPRFLPSMCDAMMARKYALKEGIESATIRELKEKAVDYQKRKAEAKALLLSYGGEWSKDFTEEKDWKYDKVAMTPVIPVKANHVAQPKQEQDNKKSFNSCYV